MNCLSYFLLVIVLCAGLNNAVLFPKTYPKNLVQFTNVLGPENILKIHCVSKDDDLGYHYLRHGKIYSFQFDDSVFKTKFDCDLWQGSPYYKFHANFRAYEGGGFVVHYGKKNFWEAREDGIYFTHGIEMPKLEYKWSREEII
ncbi:PREDICTED: uncharacterized protein LOC104704980 [Camelina sativa]|uniref:S-protein homolog n=1 Tax=Camelina sativa TaxID=90675 RepID=A0ABM0T153_CAMSA|nr:PREDICTED: uncharacterized protein LOC104704980 [Camelina sativa]